MANQSTADTRTNFTDLDLDASVLAVVGPVCERLGMRHYVKGVHLHAVMLDMVALDANGANEAELTAYGLALLEFARTLKSAHTTDAHTLARMQLDADIDDDHKRGVLHIEGKSAMALEAWAKALEKSAALNVAQARQARREAREIRVSRATAHQRLGITGGAA